MTSEWYFYRGLDIEKILYMNHLLEYSSLNNRYFIMRHGQSMANVEGIIISTPENGVPKYGLSELGRAQVKQSIKESYLKSDIHIHSSDFKRAHETSMIAHDLLKSSKDIVLETRLRERNFGDFELSSDENYQIPWAKDVQDSTHTENNVESADAVMNRVSSLIVSFEESSINQTYLLVAHGDTLQILQTAFLKQAASTQRKIPHLNTAEIRELTV